MSHDVDKYPRPSLKDMPIVNNDSTINLDVFELMSLEDMLEDLGIDSKKWTDETCYTCVSCQNKELIEDETRGMVFCRECGQVDDDIIDDSAEKHFYDADDGTARCSIVHNPLLPQSSLGIFANVSHKIKRLQRWCAMPYKERSNYELYKMIEDVCSRNKIVKMVEYDAKLICMKTCSALHESGDNVGKSIITRGNHRKGIVGGCLLISCRNNGRTRSVREIAEYFGIEEKHVNSGITTIETLLEGDQIIKNISTSKVIDFVKRKCDELKIRSVDANLAIIIGNNIERLGVASNHTIYALAAASISLMVTHNKLDIDNKKISEHFSGLTTNTINKTYKQIIHLLKLLINNEAVDEIIRIINLKRSKRVISKETAEKMRLFNVDTSKYIIEGESKSIEYKVYPALSNGFRSKSNTVFTMDIDVTDVTEDVKDILVCVYKIKAGSTKIPQSFDISKIDDYTKLIKQYVEQNPEIMIRRDFMEYIDFFEELFD